MHYKRYWSSLNVLLLFIVFTNGPVCLAQQQKDNMQDTTLMLKEVIITSTRQETDLRNVPYSTSLISHDALEEVQMRSTPEALFGQMGTFVQKTNHGGGSPFLRGLTGNQTLTLIDGIRLNNPTFRYGPNQYLNTIDPFIIDKIELLRGNGSVQYGSDAMGGVIHILSAEPEFDNNRRIISRFSGKAMSNDMEYTGRGEVEYRSDKLAILLGGTFRKFGDLLGGGTIGRQTPTGYRERSLDGKLKWRWNKTNLTIAHQFTRQDAVPLYHKIKLEDFSFYLFDPQIRRLSYLKFETKSKNRYIETITFISSIQNSDESRLYKKRRASVRTEESDQVTTSGQTLDFYSEFSDHWSSNSGIELYASKIRSDRFTIDAIGDNRIESRGLYPDNARTRNFSIFSLHHLKFGPINFEGGIRYNYLRHKIPNDDPLIAGGEIVLVKPSSLALNAAVMYRLGSGHNLFLSYSEGYRAPNIDDLGTLGLVDFRYEVPAYDLKPESAHNTEAGYKYFGKNWIGNATLFQSRLSNLITRRKLDDQEVNGYNVYIKENTDKALITGFEYSIDWYISKSIFIQNSASYTYGQNISAKEPLRRIPPFFGHSRIKLTKGKWTFTLEHLYAGRQDRLSSGDRDDNRISDSGTPGWSILNYYMSVRLNKVQLRFGLQNITHEAYRMHGSGIDGVGRSGWIAVDWEI